MAGQSIERREMLRILATASAAAGFAGFSKWAYACEEVHAAGQGRPADQERDVYAAVFLCG